MGLDMYLYKSTKKDFARRNEYYAKREKFNEKWNSIFDKFPVKSNGWEIDEDKLTDEQSADYAAFLAENKALEDEKPSCVEDREYFYWRK